MKRIALFLALAFFYLSFFACTHKPYTPVVIKTNDTSGNNNNPQDTTHTALPTDSTVCFQRDVLPIFLGSCAMSGCHDAVARQEGYNLTSYATIVQKGLVKGKSASSKLYTKCLSGKMPQSPVAKLDSTKLSLIKRWIDMGAPNDSNCAVTCDTTLFTYSGAIVPMLNNYCYSCHATPAARSVGGSIVLDKYDSLLIQVSNGKLLGDIQHAAGHNYMPLGGAKLPDCKITQVSKWIGDGAKNN